MCGLVRNNDGNLIVAYAKYYGLKTSVEAEAMALLMGWNYANYVPEYGLGGGWLFIISTNVTG